MADFARILAAYQILGTKGLPQYVDKQTSAAVDSLTGDLFVTAMRTTLTAKSTGTAAEPLEKVTPTRPTGPRRRVGRPARRPQPDHRP
jgi:hypothetical protein